MILGIVDDRLVIIAGGNCFPTSFTLINNRADLEAINNDLAGSYFLNADIDLSDAPWTPLGTFTGWFLGNGSRIISNMTITATTGDRGLFSAIQGAVVGGFKMKNPTIQGGTSGYAGAVAGRLIPSGNTKKVSVLHNILCTDGHISRGTGSGAGGIIGYHGNASTSDSSIFMNVFSKASFYDDDNVNVGTLIGRLQSMWPTFIGFNDGIDELGVIDTSAGPGTQPSQLSLVNHFSECDVKLYNHEDILASIITRTVRHA